MALLYGREWTKEELLKRVGDISQICGAKVYELKADVGNSVSEEKAVLSQLDRDAPMEFQDGRKNSTLSDATFNDDEVIVALPVAINPQV